MNTRDEHLRLIARAHIENTLVKAVYAETDTAFESLMEKAIHAYREWELLPKGNHGTQPGSDSSVVALSP
jgi:hypothetical protein